MYQQNDKPEFKSSPFKRLRFFNMVSVVLIPTRKEFKDAGIEDRIWYSKEDLKHFKAEVDEGTARKIASKK